MIPPWLVDEMQLNDPFVRLSPGSLDFTDQFQVPITSGENRIFQFAPPSQNKGIDRSRPSG